MKTSTALIALGLTVIVTSSVTYFYTTRHTTPAPQAVPPAHVLYWYDPMVPNQHFSKGGKSPFMDMQLQPKYADNSASQMEASGVKIDPNMQQNLGIRLVTVQSKPLTTTLTLAANVVLNDRDVAIIQSRSNGYVQRVYQRAVGDVIPRGAPIAELLLPEWVGAETEYLAMRRSGDKDLTAAAKQRLVLLGMPEVMVQRLEQTGQAQSEFIVNSPISGVIQNLQIRTGMTVSTGQTLAQVNGLDTVWLEASVPEAQAALVHQGQPISAQLSAYPSEQLQGSVIAVLPEVAADSRTVKVRMVLPNLKHRIMPGMYAQAMLNVGAPTPVMLVPSEAVIRTGQRTVVIVAKMNGDFQAVDVQLGSEANGESAVLQGLRVGQKVVASGQFLIDSEASLSGILSRLQAPHKVTPAQSMSSPVAQVISTTNASGMNMGSPKTGKANPAGTMPASIQTLIYGTGVVEAVDVQHITLSHQPIPALGWGAMTMPFTLDQAVKIGMIHIGDTVHFGFVQKNNDNVIESLEKIEVTP